MLMAAEETDRAVASVGGDLALGLVSDARMMSRVSLRWFGPKIAPLAAIHSDIGSKLAADLPRMSAAHGPGLQGKGKCDA